MLCVTKGHVILYSEEGNSCYLCSYSFDSNLDGCTNIKLSVLCNETRYRYIWTGVSKKCSASELIKRLRTDCHVKRDDVMKQDIHILRKNENYDESWTGCEVCYPLHRVD